MSISLYILGNSVDLPQSKIDALIDRFTNTTTDQIPGAVVVPLSFIPVRPSDEISSPTALTAYHYSHLPDEGPVNLILALDKQSNIDDTALLTANQEAEGSEASTIHCRVPSDWVNAIVANISIGHNESDHYIGFAQNGVFRGFPPFS